MQTFGYYCTIRDGMQADTAAKSVIDQRGRLKTYRLRVRRSRFSLGASLWTFWRRLICIKKAHICTHLFDQPAEKHSRELSLALPLLKKEMSVRSSQAKSTSISIMSDLLFETKNKVHIRTRKKNVFPWPLFPFVRVGLVKQGNATRGDF